MTSCCSSSKSCCDHQTKKAALTAALAGNPNCGKTTLFNALTGARQRIGNWPGVTVERKSGHFTDANIKVEVIDLPGVYSLAFSQDDSALDERLASEFLLKQQADILINIVDASNLERHLYLSLQLIEMGLPIILALNMMDVARARHQHIDIAKLSQVLNCPVIALEANKGDGIAALKRAITTYDHADGVQKLLPYPQVIEEAIEALMGPRWLAVRALEGDEEAKNKLNPEAIEKLPALQQNIQQALGEEADILIAETRYQAIHQILAQCLKTTKVETKTTWTERIDNIVLNRVLGIPIFLAMMYCLFFFSINLGGAFQDFFDIGSQTLFVDGFAHLLTQCGAPAWLTVLLASGIGKGINTTITFIPVIGAMFLFLAFLEDSGYMARAAFVIDRFMRMLGLPGKAFVPMIVGFGCNVPAVMGARTLENKRDRIITILMSPFMSCGARLAIYAVFTTAFFPHGGQNVVFALYLIGIFMAIFTGFILRKTLLKGDPSPLVMELPLYHLPRGKTLMLHAWQRLRGFVVRAGRLIVPISILIGALNSLNLDGTMNTGEGDTHSLLSLVGQWVTPIFTPMGIHTDNWPATVGLVTGILAKEVVVGTLNTIYSQVGHLAVASVGPFHLGAGLLAAWQSIPQNLSQLTSAFTNPVLAQAPIHSVNQGLYGLMYQKFDGQIGAFAYLLFVLLYFPCISTMAAMLREVHRGWSIFSALWMTGVAYGAAVFFYQAATWFRHPWSSSLWIMMIAAVFGTTISAIRWYAAREERLPEAKGEWA